MRRAISIVLVLVLLVPMPVKAQNLNGNNETSAVGQTAVTARVEMEEDNLEQSGNIKTGDESEMGTYISLFLMSAIVIVVKRIRVKKREQ